MNPSTPMFKRPTTLEIPNNIMMRPNSPTVYSPVESISLNSFKPNFKPEVPKAMKMVMTPNRPTRQPWGKYGFMPSNAPPRRSRKRSRRYRKRTESKRNRR